MAILKEPEWLKGIDYAALEKRLVDDMAGGANTGRFSGNYTNHVGGNIKRARAVTNKVAAIVTNIGKAFEHVNMSDGARAAALEIVIAQFGMQLASELGEDFDSFEFAAACKGHST